jgi:hypothetical protein
MGLCGDRILMKHYGEKNNNVVRMWKSKTFLDFLYTDFIGSSSKNFIGAIDYSIQEDHVKIEYMNQNDNEYAKNNCYYRPPFLDDQESKNMNHAMIEYVKNIAKENNKPKVVVDVHSNLRIFNHYYLPENFVITKRRCRDNGYWLEAECIL